MLMAVYGCIYGCIRLAVYVVSAYIWLSMATHNCMWLYMAVCGWILIYIYMAVYGWLWLYMVIYGCIAPAASAVQHDNTLNFCKTCAFCPQLAQHLTRPSVVQLSVVVWVFPRSRELKWFGRVASVVQCFRSVAMSDLQWVAGCSSDPRLCNSSAWQIWFAACLSFNELRLSCSWVAGQTWAHFRYTCI